MKRKQIKDRRKVILIELVRLYIKKGGAVASKLLAERLPFRVSSATIRNVLNKLEKEGYLYQLHTSAGRIPTDKGYRFYVNFIKDNKLEQRDKELINSILMMNATFEEIIDGTARMLSNITKNIALVLIPNYTKMIIRHIDFIKLTSEKILVIIITHTGSVLKKIIKVKEKITQDELISVSNYLNENFQGKTLLEIKEQILTLMNIEKFRYDLLIKRALSLAQQSLILDLVEPKIFIEGTLNILGALAKENLNKLPSILRALEEKTVILNLLNKTMEKDGVHIYIGSESEIKDFSDIALVSSTYRLNDNAKGCVGVLGPRRMYYDRIIPLVSYIGKNFNNLLYQK